MKLRRLFRAAAIALAVVNAPALSVAQTPMTPPASQDALATGAAVRTPAASAVPPSQAAIRQAANQREGLFPPMVRPSGGQIQEIWGDTEPGEGITTLRMGRNTVYKVVTREFMTTTIMLPADAKIVSADLGDPAAFTVAMRTGNMIAVRPVGYGVDTNLNIYTESGQIYPIYIRAENAQSYNVPDLLVRIIGSDKAASQDPFLLAGTDNTAANGDGEKTAINASTRSAEKIGDSPLPLIETAVEGLQTPAPSTGDWVRDVAFDPARLRGFDDYELWGDDALKPVRVFRDDRFTYVQYGEKWDAIELPTAYIVIDDIDQLVNTRVQGSTYIIEAVSPLISLKIGKKFLCLRYTGEE
jgi:ComB9 competence protein